jgi:hypothetical protein
LQEGSIEKTAIPECVFLPVETVNMLESVGVDDHIPGQKRSVGQMPGRVGAIGKTSPPQLQLVHTPLKRHSAPYSVKKRLKVTRESTFQLLDTIIEARHQNWQAAATLLERRWARYYGRPEAQLNFALAIQNNTNGGDGSGISITLREAQEIEETAEPIRAKARQMFAQYRPALENGNGKVEAQKQVVEVSQGRY